MVLPAWDDYALWALPLSVLAYFIGVIIYVCRLPERFSPGSFDIFFASHQIWHVFVFAGAALHLTGVLSWINWRQTRGTC